MITFSPVPVTIEVEKDQTCTVLFPGEYGSMKIMGLTPEQATNLKQVILAAHMRGQHQALTAAQNAIDEARKKLVYG